MVREIKFRAWIPSKKRMTRANYTLDELIRWLMPECCFDGAMWMQYTGLNDKNGVEIYEGDTVVVDAGLTKESHNYPVRFNECCWDVGGLVLSKQNIDLFNILVIGNIHEGGEGL